MTGQPPRRIWLVVLAGAFAGVLAASMSFSSALVRSESRSRFAQIENQTRQQAINQCESSREARTAIRKIVDYISRLPPDAPPERRQQVEAFRQFAFDRLPLPDCSKLPQPKEGR